MTADARWGNGQLNCESDVVQLSEQVRLCKASHALNELRRPIVRPIAGEIHRRLEVKPVKESRFSPRGAEWVLGGVEQKKNSQRRGVQAAQRGWNFASFSDLAVLAAISPLW